jgi:hypothetical protein
MANYNSEFTGPQVDEAIQQVLDNYEDWSNKADPEDVAVVAGAVTALQTAMNGKADLQAIAGAYRLRFSQVPMCFLSSVTATPSYAGNSNNQIWYCTDGKLYYHANDTDYELGSPQYILYYCGNAIYKWGGSNSNQGFIKIVDLADYFEGGRLKMDALPENLPTGGLSDDIYTAIKDNVDTLWTKLNELIGDLANLAFGGTKTSQLTNNDKTPWPENEGSDQTPALTKPANNGGTILVGTASGGLISTNVEIKGIYLTQPLVVSVSGTGFGISSSTPSPISAASANAGTTITVAYNSTSLNSATGSLLISSSEVSRTASLLVLAGGGTTQTYIVTQNLAGCSSSYLGGTVTEGTTLTIVLTPNSGWTFTGGTISATMNNVAVAVTDGQNGTKVISFGAVSGDIVITATAVEQSTPSQSIELAQGKYIAYQGTSPSTPSTPSLYTEVCCMTAPISVDSTNLGDGVDWNNCSVEWVHNNIYERGNISFIRSGGFNPDSVKAGEDATSNSYSSSTIVAGTWAARQSSVTGIIATFKYNPTTGKVAEGCRVVLKNGDTILRTLISESDLQNATFVTV